MGCRAAWAAAFFRWRLRGLALLAILGTVQVAATVIDGLVSAGSPNGALATIGALGVSIALDLGLFIGVFVLLTSYPATVREILPRRDPCDDPVATSPPGGGLYRRARAQAHQRHYGLFAVVLGTLAWIHIGAQATLYASS